jgi:hypothetical protein
MGPRTPPTGREAADGSHGRGDESDEQLKGDDHGSPLRTAMM